MPFVSEQLSPLLCLAVAKDRVHPGVNQGEWPQIYRRIVGISFPSAQPQ